ncbi:MAG: porin family protein [Bacteroidota bacterium]
MKKTYLLIILLGFIVNISEAQEYSYGLQVGTNFSSLLTDRDVIFNENGSFTIPEYAGFNVGVFGEYQFNEQFGLVTNLLYSNRGFDTSPNITVSSLSLNPNLKFDVNKSYGKGFYLKAGLIYSFILDGKSDTQDLSDTLKNSVFGATLGAGIDFSDIFALELLFDYAFTDLFDTNEKSKIFGANLLLSIHIQSLIEK